ncbi:hypothetical protein IMZ48_30035 [Candidatus Bathyarchaeota archaeon]|nr:hypothetical protein [Candidatus Bathyarchaeota archaeon]
MTKPTTCQAISKLLTSVNFKVPKATVISKNPPGAHQSKSFACIENDPSGWHPTSTIDEAELGRRNDRAIAVRSVKLR